MRAPVSLTEAAEAFAQLLQTSLGDGSFVRLVLSSPIADKHGAERVLGRLVDLRGHLHLSFTCRYASRDEVENVEVGRAAEWVRVRLGTHFASALLGTTRGDWQFAAPSGKRVRLVRHPARSKQPPDRAHDRRRQTLLDHSATDWLHGLQVTDENGRVRPSMEAKYAQINRYLEIFSHLADECGWRKKGQQLPAEICIADMGCGKGYLTFGLWHMLHRLWGLPARIIGVETRLELVELTSSLAQKIGASGLEFIAGTIESAPLSNLTALIALHACDTATDDAIARGVVLRAELILVAPCCHKQLRPEMAAPPVLAGVMTHGIMRERLAEWLTDGLRALFLERAGYQTKIMEFVGSEHTPKNLLLAGIKRGDAEAQELARRRILELKEFFGIRHHPLDPLLESGGSTPPSQC